MLDEAARAYVNQPRGARFGGWGLIVSSIYEWYQADFGGTDAGVIRHLKKYAPRRWPSGSDQRTEFTTTSMTGISTSQVPATS